MKYRSCEICGLKTERKDGVKRYFMARFPVDEARCKQWVKATGKEDLAYIPVEKLHANKFICGKHFNINDFKKKKTQLKKTAIPTQMLTSPPLAEDILSGFPCHVYSKAEISLHSTVNSFEDKQMFHENEIPIVENTEEIVSECKFTTIGCKDITRKRILVSKKDCLPIPLIKESTSNISATIGCKDITRKRILVSKKDCLPIPLIKESTSNISATIGCKDITRKRILVSKKDCLPIPLIKESTSNISGLNILLENERKANLKLRLQTKKLIVKLNKYKKMVKLLRKKVKDLDYIKSPALKTLIKSITSNYKRQPQGRRWSNDIKGLILSIYKTSPIIYRQFKQLIPLPSERTLQKILKNVPIEPVTNEAAFIILKKEHSI